jgi:hypothetical protein
MYRANVGAENDDQNENGHILFPHALCCNKNITSQSCDIEKEKNSRRVLLQMHLASYHISSHSRICWWTCVIMQEDWVLCRVFNKAKPSEITEQSSSTLHRNHNHAAPLLCSLQPDTTTAGRLYDQQYRESTGAVSHCGSFDAPLMNLAMLHQDGFLDYCSPVVHGDMAVEPHNAGCSGGGDVAIATAPGRSMGFENHGMGKIETEYDVQALLLGSYYYRDGIYFQ